MSETTKTNNTESDETINKAGHFDDVVSSRQAGGNVNEDGGCYVMVGTAQGSKKVKVIEFIQLDYIDERKLEVVELADDTFVIGIVNSDNTDRAKQQHMRLTRDSFYGLFAALLMFTNADPNALKLSTSKQKIIEFRASDKVMQANDDASIQAASTVQLSDITNMKKRLEVHFFKVLSNEMRCKL